MGSFHGHQRAFLLAARGHKLLAIDTYVTNDLLQRSDHRNVQNLEADIRNWVKEWNENPKPFIWTKTAEQILESLKRLLQRTNGAGH